MEGMFQPMHILVLLVGSVCYTGVVVGVVLVVISLIRKNSRGSDHLSSLEAENQRLQEEIDRLKSGKA